MALAIFKQNYKTDYRQVMNPDRDSIVRFLTQEYQHGDVVSMTADDMLEALPKYNHEAHANVLATMNDYTTLGGMDASLESPMNAFDDDGAYFEKEKITFINDHSQTEEEFANIQNKRIAGASFIEALYDRIDIATSVLDNMF